MSACLRAKKIPFQIVRDVIERTETRKRKFLLHKNCIVKDTWYIMGVTNAFKIRWLTTVRNPATMTLDHPPHLTPSSLSIIIADHGGRTTTAATRGSGTFLLYFAVVAVVSFCRFDSQERNASSRIPRETSRVRRSECPVRVIAMWLLASPAILQLAAIHQLFACVVGLIS